LELLFSSTEFLSSSRYFQDFLLTNGFNQAGAGALSGAVTGAIAVSASLALGAASASYSAGALTAGAALLIALAPETLRRKMIYEFRGGAHECLPRSNPRRKKIGALWHWSSLHRIRTT
jgi:hypothetical protein